MITDLVFQGCFLKIMYAYSRRKLVHPFLIAYSLILSRFCFCNFAQNYMIEMLHKRDTPSTCTMYICTFIHHPATNNNRLVYTSALAIVVRPATSSSSVQAGCCPLCGCQFCWHLDSFQLV